jgi:hypothetical protein
MEVHRGQSQVSWSWYKLSGAVMTGARPPEAEMASAAATVAVVFVA